MRLLAVGVAAAVLAGCGSGGATAGVGSDPGDAGEVTRPDAAQPDARERPSVDAALPPIDGGEGGAPAPSHSIKWHPGHYLASGGIVRPGSTIFAGEMDHLDKQDAFRGYRMFITWGALEPTKGTYDFSQIDATLSRLKTQYDLPKTLVLVVLPGSFTSTAPGANDWTDIPEYIQTTSTYGPSPVSGRYGWWGGHGNGNTYAAALHRPAVMERWVALHQALGAKYDSEPALEAIMIQEDSWSIGTASTNGCPDYSDAAMNTGFRSLVASTLAAFPHTSVVFENSWLGTPTLTQEFEQWMVENRVAPGTADTYGQTFIDSNKGVPNNWGLQAYFGITATGSTYTGPDDRPIARAMLDVEGPDLGAYGYAGYAPLDIIHAANQSYRASHLFWTYLEANSHAPPASLWPALSVTCAANLLANIGYPVNYP